MTISKAQVAALEWLLCYNKISPRQCRSDQLVAVVKGLHRYEARCSDAGQHKAHEEGLWRVERACVEELASRPEVLVDSIIACFRDTPFEADGDEEHPLGEINDFLRDKAMPSRIAKLESSQLMRLFKKHTHQEIRAAVLSELQGRKDGLSCLNSLWAEMDTLNTTNNDLAYFALICSRAKHATPEEWLEMYFYVNIRMGVIYNQGNLELDEISWDELVRIAELDPE